MGRRCRGHGPFPRLPFHKRRDGGSRCFTRFTSRPRAGFQFLGGPGPTTLSTAPSLFVPQGNMEPRALRPSGNPTWGASPIGPVDRRPSRREVVCKQATFGGRASSKGPRHPGGSISRAGFSAPPLLGKNDGDSAPEGGGKPQEAKKHKPGWPDGGSKLSFDPRVFAVFNAGRPGMTRLRRSLYRTSPPTAP